MFSSFPFNEELTGSPLILLALYVEMRRMECFVAVRFRQKRRNG